MQVLCRVLEVPRSGYYAWRRRGLSARAEADVALGAQIQASHQRSRGTYGAPRMHADLAATGVAVGRKRVARLLRAAGLVGCSRRQRPHTTQADPAATPAPNHVDRQFVATGPNLLWVGDITYVPTAEGWLYVAVIVDVWSRKVVGWAMADHLRTELALAALAMAVRQQRPDGTALTHHTDRGCQYTAGAYQAQLTAHGIRVSMSRTANCYDNALAESFFATFKAELIDRQPWATRTQAQGAIFEWIEVFYNRQRRHSALAYATPLEFERRAAAVGIS